MEFTVQIPVKPYVKVWLEKKFRYSKSKKILISSDTEVGKFFFELTGKNIRRRDSQFRNYATTITIVIRESLFLRNGVMLTDTNITKFNNFVEDIIKSELRAHTTALVNFGGFEISKALGTFNDLNGFDESSWPLESQKKDYYRFREENKKKNKAA